MIAALSLVEIVKETGGELTADARFERVCTDTRTLQTGDLYVALTGKHFNGNQFVAEAANAGAIAAVVSEEVVAPIPQLKVADSRLALGLIARSNRRLFTGPLIGLTGSAGKTTTKEMVASILAEQGLVLATAGNLNNEIGVPQTLLQINAEHQFAVIEMGASRSGDIAYLGQFVEPTISVLTNAMPAHIEGFGDIATVAKTKGEIFECLPAGGVAVLNMDDDFYLQWLQQASNARVVTFSKSNVSADFYASNIALKNNTVTTFDLHAKQQGINVKLALLGEHNVVNALAAAAAAMAAGASLEQVKAGLEKVSPVAGRLKTWVGSDLTVIDDSYNASPGSVNAAIDVLAGFPGRRCLVLGAMAELGEQAEQCHMDVARYARQQGIEQLLAVGEYAEQMLAVFNHKGKAYKRQDQLLLEIEQVLDAAVVLIKGSRSAQMERVVSRLLENNTGKN